ncbi:MAG: SDR family oxidoreductase [Pirellulales bacterium]|nr:SDR family oxidoreductase [Pirellulales bacterium]
MRDANSATSEELSGLRALVTGASSGIGRAIALELARGGANVLVHARSSETALNEVAEEIRALGRQADVFLADLADVQQQDALVAWAWADAPVDIWVNNAGVDVLTGAAAKMAFDEKLASLWAVDVTATTRISRSVGERMRSRGSGVILNQGWDQAATGMAGDSGELFAAAKGAVMAFSLSLARSLAPHVRVNCLAPGWIKTAWGKEASESWQARAQRESLLGRWGTPEDVAHVARFLASPAASFINGQVVPVNGGFRGDAVAAN